ncbi:MAG: DNA topoisomerase III [Acidobacteria bacterium]|nr:DNA topoisomerase III [Acidobacteriota bacterium]
MSSSNTAIVAEKPSVARDIARVVGASARGEGYLHGGGYVVTWAIGHLVHLAEPHEMRPEWKSWRRDQLPMLPREWPLVVYDQTSDQFEVVRQILASPKIDSVVCATDAGREGELIFRYIYEKTGCTKPVRRLWISSLTPDAIRKGLDTMKSGTDFDRLADAARGRSRADWLVGMNLSRAYTLALGGGEKFSVGRVQTPTLAMLVERELEVRAFVPEDYIEVVASFSPAPGNSPQYDGTWFRDDGKAAPRDSTRLASNGVEAEAIVARARSGQAVILSVEGETKRMAPPLLYDLTELQRHANRLYGFSAQKTLEVAQALYERHKLLSYPRTDSRHLSADVAKTLPGIVAAVSGPYQMHLAPGAGTRPLSRRYVDDTKVTDHYAIIPTMTQADVGGLNEDERRIYDLVCRRLLQAWHDDHIWRVTTVITAIENPGIVDKYLSSGTAVEQPGWKVLDIAPPAKKKRATAKDAESGGAEDDDSKSLPPGLAAGQPQQVVDVEALRKKTRPPKRFTEATLLTAMESAGKTLDDKELSDAMKETGLGTPATRASIIEVLLTRGYAERQGKMLAATDKGIHLIEVVHPEVKSPAMTGQWEAALQRIHRGQGQLPPFMTGIEEYVTSVVGKVFSGSGPVRAPRASREPQASSTPAAGIAPLPPRVDLTGQPIETILKERFGFDEFRPGQEAVCRAVVDGQDALVVMPTGAGKSLCYQLPGLARGGTTIVVSPLIALMEDQVGKLRALGFHAERIHSGLLRAASRQVCIDYLNGNLDFLFIAPERFRVPGFPEMLAKRKPSLVCIDEAHCISQWGHDFRPDYRRIGPYLESFRPAPVLALTATATPRVQHDIGAQLQLNGPHFIQGFRRTNLAIEVVESAPSRRPELAKEILSEDGRLPGIVYTPSRKEAESVAALLGGEFSVAAYHAGLDAQRRADVQARFLGGSLDVIVATIAFGMGIDKADIRTVIHTAAPGSIEAYYQEIGRAGRDGGISHAILMQSYADRRTHDFFFERDYPDPLILSKLYAKLTDRAIPKDDLRGVAGLGDAFDAALEKLWIHGGAIVDFEENVMRGEPNWRPSYEGQRNDKLARLEDMLRYADCHQCRMQALVTHFGETRGGPARCGICDFCAPAECIAQSYRDATAQERAAAEKALKRLAQSGGTLAAGRVHSDIGGDAALERREFERVLGGLARVGIVRLEDAVFEKDGRTIPYRKVHLTMDGRAEMKSGEAPVFEIVEVLEAGRGQRRRTRTAKAKAKPATAAKKRSVAVAPKEKAAAAPKKSAAASSAPPPAVIDALKAWRLAEAKRHQIPAFRVMTDATLTAIAAKLPRSTNELLAISGMGLRNVEKYGAAIFRVLGKTAPRGTV